MATFSRNLYYFYHKGFSVFSPEPPANMIYTDSVLYVKEPNRLNNTQSGFYQQQYEQTGVHVTLTSVQVSAMIYSCSLFGSQCEHK